MSSDLNLLFGLMAVQMNFVSQDALVRATNVWTQAKHRTVADILLEQGQITRDQLDLINALVQEKLRQNDNDTQKSLASLSSVDSARRALGEVTDDDVQHTMTQMGPPPSSGFSPPSGSSAPAGTVGGSPGSQATPFHLAGHATMPASGSRPAPAPNDGRRFRVLRPHARGGLGEVFVAQDQEINREVALKEILSKHAVDADSRGRFLMEAEITGGLEHPGIVPVYGLGTYADGRPYYAMRFIHGDSLKEAIAHFHEKEIKDEGERNLAFRNLLKRFVDVCNAIGYAHSRGVLHRDLKPGNIMLGKYGETLVVDWGLAKTIGDTTPEQGGKSTGDEKSIQPTNASSIDATVAGTAIGTPAFMSPEQAEGRLDILGKPSDIYSLGATLYALVVGEIPFNGRNVGELLERVKRGEYVHPIKARPGIPAALNAIVVKSMAVRPEDRYPTAMALAGDIEHFLADEPVSAYAEPFADRARRWARKHRTFMSVAGVTVVTLLFALTAGLYFVNAEKNRTILERNAKEAARAAEQDQREKAERARNSALDALDAMTSNFTRDSLITQQEITPEQKKFLEEAHSYYLGLMREEGSGEAERKRRAQAAFRVGTIERRLGRNGEAESSFENAASQFKGLVTDFPKEPEYRFDEARAFNNTGLARYQDGRHREAIVAFNNAVILQEKLAPEFPQKPEYTRQWARSLTNLGNSWRAQGEADEAIRVLRQAIALQTKLSADHPTVPDYRNELAGSVSNLAITLLERGKPGEAEPLLRRALDIRENLRTQSPAEAIYQEDLAKTHVNLSNTAKALGKATDATGELRKAAEIYESLQQTYPSMPQYQQQLATTYYNLGETLNRLKTAPAQETLEVLQRALNTQKNLSSRFPKNPDYRSLLARSHNFLGNMLLDRKQNAEAGREYAEAISVQTKLVGEFPKNRDYRADLALSHNNRGVLLKAGNQPAEAEKDFRAAVMIQQQLIDEFPAQVAYQLNQAMTSRNLGDLLREAKPPEALTWFDKAVSFSEAVVGKTPGDTKALTQLKEALIARQKHFEQQKDAPKAAADAKRIGDLDITLRLKTAANLIAAGRVADVIPAVETLVKRPELQSHHHVEIARIYAMAAGRDMVNAKKFADEAINWLAKAAAGGFADLQSLAKESDFAAIWDRDDFKQLFAGK